MASIATDSKGRRRVLFVDQAGSRKMIYLGELPLRVAEQVKCRVEHLLAAKLAGVALDAETAHWVAELPEALANKLAKVGLIPPRKATAAAAAIPTLGEFLDAHLAKRTDIKPSSLLVQRHVVRNLRKYFGADCDPRTITPGKADDFRRWLTTQGLASTTIHKRMQHVKAYFRAMVRHRLLTENPFAEVRSPAVGIADRQFFVTLETTAKLLDACPNHHWRTIIGLARYGGLRCPSEVLSLRWSDVLWAENRIVVQSPKTEVHGKASRVIPLFAILQPILAEAFERAEPGEVYVVDERYRQAATIAAGWGNANLRTGLLRIIARAGLEPWPRLFQNMRSSRQTELAEKLPGHVVCKFMGNTEDVARRHYLQTTDAHYEAALSVGAEPTREPTRRCARQSARQSAQHAYAAARTGGQPSRGAHEKAPGMPGLASRDLVTQQLQVAAEGLESFEDSPGNPAMPSEDSAPECAHGARDAVLDADLEQVVRAWPALPEAVRRQVLDLIDGAVSTAKTTGPAEGR